ncbi:MAG: phosphatidylglycerophosphatase A [Nitrospirae bacterium CG_4_9_14_3_um_filter_53_35]|nr:MAG: phosphatidylglycerophosphatase A [Nitrospirae bacterium CG2_30_53_67]PIS37024.1 MAG: phosphatidylglycerophosphatase A [Nitrospirae bacterium CG08_land_8_20_14_0_20_52_24]PIV85296.1 MAG: phosphatidylglycerophosphatase A [Nitrospirae bacterium CG17_big_fil_post_rev_8_21_14_2_50_50_9]PIW84954.1 MAG: phosphatidylglycerophosphatase A [Nitrospirae bacterium CG_4_8_14_3_um_filter_50_41]PIX84740.1 MAG: phosphatidylglycerophosphatase A [Nitrospirae bacterium CG_4_10_14_3_um_filter_53_41]PJA7688
MDRIILFFASGFLSGYAPLASGTAGTLVGIAIFILLNQFPLKLYGILTSAIVFFGVWLSSRAEAILGEKDSGVIVIDEIAGFLITMFALPMTWQTIVIGFFVFRAFDIFKPFPIRRIDQRVPGGWGVMLDDVLAGVYANLTIHLLRRVM